MPAPMNPFNIHFENSLNPITKQIEVGNKSQSGQYEDNRSFCPEFFTFIQLHICEMPLWSGLLLGSLNQYNKMEILKSQEEKLISDEAFLSYKTANAKWKGYIEGVMRQLKQEDVLGKKQMRADALENYEHIRRQLNDFGDRIHTTLKPKYRKRKPNVDNSSSPKEKK